MNLLEARGLNVAIGSRSILSDISLVLNPGEIVALLGPNGSGKTTLLSALIGYRRGSGSIRWNDQPIESIERGARAKLVSLLPQVPIVPEISVRDFIALGRTATLGWFGVESRSEASILDTILIDLDLVDLAHRSMHRLSGGQRQRALIGRSLAQQAATLLLDEPDTFLDLKQQQMFGRLLRRLARDRGLAVVLASHDLNLAIQLADRFVLLKDGRVLAEGAMDRLQPQQLSQAFDLKLARSSLIAPVDG